MTSIENERGDTMRLTEIFVNICNKSMAVSYVIPVILVLRFVFERIRLPKKYSYYLWMIPLIRLICPVPFSSVFSLFNIVSHVPEVGVADREYIPFQMQEPVIGAGIESAVPAMHTVSNTSDSSALILLTYIWAAGIFMFCLYSLISFFRVKKTVRTAVRWKGNIYECGNIHSPFVMGIFFPKIYIPFRMQEAELDYILRHERFHIKRKDHVIKLIFFIVAVLYWFHPLVWLAFFCMGRDMEMSCDEKILVEMGGGIKENYSMSLLSFASNRRMRLAGPLAFGETDTRRRIRNVLNFRQPKARIALVGIVLVAAAALVCLTSQKESRVQAASLSEDTLSVNNAVDEAKLQDIPADRTDAGASPAEGFESVHAFVTRWAKAFCGRDGDTILKLTTDEGRKALEEHEMLSEEEGSYMFGFSSPWPIEDGGYRILGSNESSAEILYYAWTSDPHLTVWRESLTLQMTEDGYKAAGGSIEEFGQISSPDEFFRAYPGGMISNTMMDYEANGLGEILNRNAKEQAESKYYKDLFDPARSARCLLNLALDDELVSVEFQEDTQSVLIKFSGTNAMIGVSMLQPYGEDGIWIPCSYESSDNLLAENQEEDISVYGLFSEDGKKNQIKFDIGGEETIFDCNWDYIGYSNKLEVYGHAEDGMPRIFAFTMLYQNTGTSEVWRLFAGKRYDTGEVEITEFLPEDYMAQARGMIELTIDDDGILRIWGNGKALAKESVPADAGDQAEAALLDNLVFMDADDEGLKMMLAVGYRKEGRIVAAAKHPIMFQVGYGGLEDHMFKLGEYNSAFGQEERDYGFTLEDAEVDMDLKIKMWE